nr:hypothetical protein [Desulfobacterales bacterium]
MDLNTIFSSEEFYKFIVFSSIIYIPLFFGWLARKRGYLDEKLSRSLTKWTIVFMESPIILFSFWALDLSNLGKVFVVPLIAALLSCFCILYGLFFSQRHGHNPLEKGAYVGCACFSNIGITMGSFLAFLMLGERGLRFAVLYFAYFVPFFFTIGFALARRYSSEDVSLTKNIKSFFTDPVSFTPNLAVVLGSILNVCQVEQFTIIKPLNNTLVYTSTLIYSLAIGLTIHLGRSLYYLKEVFSLGMIKFILSPVTGMGLAYIFGLFSIPDEIPLKVIFIQSCMPPAIFSLVLSRIFNLNQDLANACWLCLTFATLLEIPVICFVLKIL